MNTNDINNLLDKIKQIDNKNLSKNEIEELKVLENKLKDFINIESNIQLLNIDENIKKELIKTIKNKQTYKKYGLVWENQDEKNIEELKSSYPILRKQCEIKNDNTTPTNILIEGDNLHALYMLTYTHKEKIDIITIDPPYNTKNKDFCYNDKFIGEDDEYRHSKWLSFMKPRLELAKELLKDDGVIFINIDDNEFAQLKLLCDEIFDENNFIQNFLWNKSSGGSSLSKFSRNDYEYILCYAKDINKIQHEFLGEYSEGMGDSSLINKPNKYSKLIFPINSIEFTNKLNKNHTIKAFKIENFELHNDLIIENGKNKNIAQISANWKWTQKKLENELDNKTKIIAKTTSLRLRYIKDNEGSIIKPTKSITNKNNVGYTVTGTSELLGIFGYISFDFPKPTSLIKYLIRMTTYSNKNGVILDFFAGSGTTGNAVLELNKEDNGNRQFILCTNNEVNEKKQNEIKKELKDKGLLEDTLEWDIEFKERKDKDGICKKVTYPRLEKVINGYTNSKEKEIEGLGGNLKYYKIEMEEKKETKTQNIENLVDKLNPIISIAENCFNGYKQKKGKYILFKNDDNTKIVGVCTTPWSSASLKEEIINELKQSGIEEKIMYINAENLDIKTSLDDREDWKDIIFKSIPTELLSNYTLNDHIINNID